MWYKDFYPICLAGCLFKPKTALNWQENLKMVSTFLLEIWVFLFSLFSQAKVVIIYICWGKFTQTMCLDWKHLEEESIFSISHMCSRWMTYTVIQGRSRQLGQRSLTCCGSWGRRVRRDWATEQQEQLSVVHKIACTSEQRQKLEEKEDFSTIFLSVRFIHICFHLVRTMNILAIASPLNGHKFEQTLGDRGGWGCKESDMT